MNVFYNPIQDAFRHPKLGKLNYPRVIGDETLPSWFEVSDLATASMGAAVASVARYCESFGYDHDQVELNRRLVNLWFGFTLKFLDTEPAPAWDAIAGDYQTSDGWIRLHTNAPHHKQAALAVLKCEPTREAVQQAVIAWKADVLETAVIENNGCAAQMHSLEEWAEHAHGENLINQPLVAFTEHTPTTTRRKSSCNFNPKKPLSGIKVLDLTRVLAGPVAGRFLAAFGADVLRIDPADWDEPGVIPEVTLGKRCAELNLKSPEGKQQFIELVKQADVLLHGYRTDALEALGFSAEELKALNPNLINVSLNAYGWEGDWRNRRGFDSLMQMSSGIAHYGMVKSGAEKPKPLPVQALDHATGYFLATSVIQALELRDTENIITTANASLAATAHLLVRFPRDTLSDAMPVLNETDFALERELTPWGDAKRVKFPVKFPGVSIGFNNGAVALRSSIPQWESETLNAKGYTV